MDADEAISRLQDLERDFARLHALQADLLVIAASPERCVDEYLVLDPRADHDEQRRVRIADAVREEIAAALHWSPAATQAKIDRLLGGSLRRTKDALVAGTISIQHAAVISESAERVPEHCEELQDRLLAVAERSTVACTRRAASRAVLAIDAAGAERRRRSARAFREVYVVDEADGLSTLVARMATDRAYAVMAFVNAVAHASRTDGAPGSIGELRCEALETLVLGHHNGEPVAIRAHLDVLVSLDALIGITDEPAELAGAGAISIDAVRDLLADGQAQVTIRRLVTQSETGHLLDVGRSSYRIPDRLREFIITRDRVCRFPGCSRRAARCQIDHAISWDDGGSTVVANLGSVCIRHHQLKTHGGWHIENSKPDGSCEWISPQGRRYAELSRAAS